MFWTLLANIGKEIGKVALANQASKGGVGGMAASYGLSAMNKKPTDKKQMTDEEYRGFVNNRLTDMIAQMQLYGADYYTQDPYSPFFLGGGGK